MPFNHSTSYCFYHDIYGLRVRYLCKYLKNAQGQTFMFGTYRAELSIKQEQRAGNGKMQNIQFICIIDNFLMYGLFRTFFNFQYSDKLKWNNLNIWATYFYKKMITWKTIMSYKYFAKCWYKRTQIFLIQLRFKVVPFLVKKHGPQKEILTNPLS